MIKGLWPAILAIVLTSVIAWGAWATVNITKATPRPVFDSHCKAAEERFERVQSRIEDKLDKIQERLMDHNVEDDN